ncbi:hypothetical protein AMJ85_02430 [candidate division BRC1 bacterium SM23_51]|nr:MAG: hypothetical protein AMJ85_02430 [candidate division BRC1 bacterium SM23_51]
MVRNPRPRSENKDYRLPIATIIGKVGSACKGDSRPQRQRMSRSDGCGRALEKPPEQRPREPRKAEQLIAGNHV